MLQANSESPSCKSSSDISKICEFSLTREILLNQEYLEEAFCATLKSNGQVNVMMKLIRHYGVHSDMKVSLEEIRKRTTYKSRTSIKRHLEKLQKDGYLIIHKNFTPKSLQSFGGYLANSYTVTKLIHYDYQLRLKNKKALAWKKKAERSQNKKIIAKYRKLQTNEIIEIGAIARERIAFKNSLEDFVGKREPKALYPRDKKSFVSRIKRKKTGVEQRQEPSTKPQEYLQEAKPPKKEQQLTPKAEPVVVEETMTPAEKKIERSKYFSTACNLLQMQIARDPSKMPKICNPLKAKRTPYKPTTKSDNPRLKKKRDLEYALSKLSVQPWNMPMVPLADIDGERVLQLAHNMASIYERTEKQQELYREVLFFDNQHGMHDNDVCAQLTTDERFHEYIKRSPNYTESVWGAS